MRPDGGEPAITSPTQLALYSMDGLQEAIEWANQGLGADETACIWLAYLRWLRSRGLPLPEAGLVPQPRPIDAEPLLQAGSGAADASLDPEVLAALSTGEMGTRQRPVNTVSTSPAPLVRSAPFGLLPYVETETVYKLSLDAASLTHGHPAARHAAAVFASVVHGLLTPGVPLREAAAAAVERAARVSDDDGGSPDLVNRLRAVLAGNGHGAGDAAGSAATVPNGADGLLHGTAEEALALGLEVSLAAEDQVAAEGSAENAEALNRTVSAAIRRAAESGGTPAAVVTGSLLGTAYGADSLPEAATVREHSVIDKLATAFAAATIAP